MLSAGCGSPAPARAPAPAPAPAPVPTTPEPAPAPVATGEPGSSECSRPPPGPGYECVQNCGPPVARAGDPPPGSSWLSPENADKRRKFGCPICLPGATRLATPNGDVAVSALRVGDPIWTLDAARQRIAGRVLYAGSTPISGPHHAVRVTLADGRVVEASPGHPTLSGRTLSTLRPGDALSNSTVVRAQNVPFGGTRTYDVLPSGPTGAYWADGVVLRSSFRR